MYCNTKNNHCPGPANPPSPATPPGPTSVKVRGDAFLSRLFDNDDAFVRMNLSLSEVSSGAPWVAAAELQARKRMRQGDRAADFMSQLQQQKQKAPAAKVWGDKMGTGYTVNMGFNLRLRNRIDCLI